MEGGAPKNSNLKHRHPYKLLKLNGADEEAKEILNKNEEFLRELFNRYSRIHPESRIDNEMTNVDIMLEQEKHKREVLLNRVSDSNIQRRLKESITKIDQKLSEEPTKLAKAYLDRLKNTMPPPPLPKKPTNNGWYIFNPHLKNNIITSSNKSSFNRAYYFTNINSNLKEISIPTDIYKRIKKLYRIIMIEKSNTPIEADKHAIYSPKRKNLWDNIIIPIYKKILAEENKPTEENIRIIINNMTV